MLYPPTLLQVISLMVVYRKHQSYPRANLGSFKSSKVYQRPIQKFTLKKHILHLLNYILKCYFKFLREFILWLPFTRKPASIVEHKQTQKDPWDFSCFCHLCPPGLYVQPDHSPQAACHFSAALLQESCNAPTSRILK